MAVDRVRVLEAEKNAWIEVTLHEGKHHEVKRLLEAVGHPVSKLRRVSVGSLTLRGMKPGDYRSLTPQEVRGLQGGARKAQARPRPPVRKAPGVKALGLPHPAHIEGLERYEPGKPIEEVQRELGLRRVVKLASNENPLRPSPAALAGPTPPWPRSIAIRTARGSPCARPSRAATSSILARWSWATGPPNSSTSWPAPTSLPATTR